MRVVRLRVAVACVAASMVSCHLADDLDPPKCEPGTHIENRHCVQDPIDGLAINLTTPAGGTQCAGDPAGQRPPVVDPETLHVGSGKDFRFVNRDTIDHEIRGSDGQTWVTVKAGGPSVFMAIVKTGSWEYRLSGCAKGGIVVVE